MCKMSWIVGQVIRLVSEFRNGMKFGILKSSRYLRFVSWEESKKGEGI